MMMMITGTSRRHHISPVLRQLHWLPVRHRVEFKLAVLVFKALHGLAPQYLADEWWLPTRHCGWLVAVNYDRQTPSRAYVITRTRLGDRSFAVAGPCLWNSLPAELRHPTISLGQFRRVLKTHLFLNWVRRLVTLAFSAPYKFSYLLTIILVSWRYFETATTRLNFANVNVLLK